MKEEVALIIIYNHQYNRNIEVLEGLYKDRFSNIFHLVPYYEGELENVIPVYESSLNFQGYVAQGYHHIKKSNYIHYFFIGDDLILNPSINEFSYEEIYKLNRSKSYIPNFINLHDPKGVWGRIGDAFNFKINQRGIEIEKQLPTNKEALECFRNVGLSLEQIPFERIWKTPKSFKDWARKFKTNPKFFLRFMKNRITKKKYNLPYPLIGSYSDTFIVSGERMKKFAHYCGVFASANLFVEIAIPTALVLSTDQIVTENDLELKGKALWPDGWARLDGSNELAFGDEQELDRFDFDLNLLFSDFPSNYLYLHPIKLSKWKFK